VDSMVCSAALHVLEGIIREARIPYAMANDEEDDGHNNHC
jgi:hypothetical protein